MGWYIRIQRGETFRVPITVKDELGNPISFISSEIVISPEPVGQPALALNNGNGKLITTIFNWIGNWSNLTSYSPGDAVKHSVLGQDNNLWIAIQFSIDKAPGEDGSEDFWESLHQFEVLLSSVETASYEWAKGTYRWTRTYDNGDVKVRTGLVEVSN